MARDQPIIKKSLFKPPAYRWVFLCIFSMLFMLIIYGMMHQFVPSPTWYALGFKLNIGFTMLMTCWFYYMLRLNAASLTELYKRYYQWFVILSVPAIFYFLGYMSIIYSIGNLVSSLSGTPHTMHDVMQKEYAETSKSCKTRLIGKSLLPARPPHFCISTTSFNQLPKEIVIKLVGKKNYFGFALNHIEYDWEKTLKLYPSTLIMSQLPNYPFCPTAYANHEM